MKKKSKDFMIYFGDNGVAKHYDDTYDITIHCESEEEQQAALECIKSRQWVPCSERLPEHPGVYLVTLTAYAEKCVAAWYDKNKEKGTV